VGSDDLIEPDRDAPGGLVSVRSQREFASLKQKEFQTWN
jgi:hypothetical protein